MAAVYEHARALVRTLRESGEARMMRRLGTKVESDKRLEALLTDFRQQQLAVQATFVQGQTPNPNATASLQRAAQAVEGEQLLREYMHAETEYGKMLMEVQQILAEAYEVGVPGR